MKRVNWLKAACAALLLVGLAPGLASAQTETLYVPIEPCRLVDTRQAVGKFGGGQESRNYFAFEFSPGEIEGQGGTPGGCGIPTTAVAVHMVFTAIDPAANGWFRAWAWGDSEPNATVLNYTTGENISVGVPVPVCPNVCSFEWIGKKYVGAIHLVADAVGYYIPESPPVQAAAQTLGRP